MWSRFGVHSNTTRGRVGCPWNNLRPLARRLQTDQGGRFDGPLLYMISSESLNIFNLHLLGKKVLSYTQGETKMWDVGVDAFDS